MSESPAPPSSEMLDATTGERVAAAAPKRTITLSSLTKIVIESPTLGPLEFRQVTVGSLTDLEKRLKGYAGSERDLVAETLQLHLTTPSSESAIFVDLADPELFAIAADWGSRRGTLGVELSAGNMPGAFAGALRDLPDRTLKSVHEAMKPGLSAWLAKPIIPPSIAELMRPSPVIEAMQRQFAQQAAFEKSIRLDSGYLAALKEAAVVQNLFHKGLFTSEVTNSISLAMERFRAENHSLMLAMQQFQSENEVLRELFNPWPSLYQSILDAMRLRDRAADMANLAGIRSADRMVRRLDSVATSVEHVWTDWAERSRPDVEELAKQIEGASANLLNASLVTDTLLGEEGAEATLESLRHDPLTLEALIVEWQPALLEPLKGSRHALNSRGPDYVRQHGASLRELMRAALHALAPDADVLSWAQANRLIDGKGRPTRRARVTFICTLGAPTPYAELVTRVVDHYLSVVDFLDKGVHRVRTTSQDDQHAKLQLAQRNAENVLRQLIALKLLRG